MQIEVWSDIVCPWCYLGKRNLDTAIAAMPFREEVRVTFRSFELDPGAPADSTTAAVEMLASKYGMTREQSEQTQSQMERRAAAAGLTFRLQALRSGNTRAAHRLLHLAKDRGIQGELVEALHRAYFTEQRDIFDVRSLTAIATEVGLARAEAHDLLSGDAYTADVVADEELARSFGATAVPFFVLERRHGVSGAQPAEVLIDAMQRAYDGANAS